VGGDALGLATAHDLDVPPLRHAPRHPRAGADLSALSPAGGLLSAVPPVPRVRLEVALAPGVHARATAEAHRRGLPVAAWLAEVAEVALAPTRCEHRVAAPAPMPEAPDPAVWPNTTAAPRVAPREAAERNRTVTAETIPQPRRLTRMAYNDALVLAALADHRRVISTPPAASESPGRAEIPGPVGTTLADQHKQRGCDTRLYDGRTPPKGRRGGRPRGAYLPRSGNGGGLASVPSRRRLTLAPGPGSR
jgi:hypothetical protein